MSFRQCRKGAGYTQKSAAEALGVNRRTVNTIEQGKHMPRGTLFLKMCQTYNCSPGELLEGEAHDAEIKGDTGAESEP